LLSTIGGKERPTLNSTALASGSDFYANLIWLDGRKCLLATHAATLFSVFAPDVRAADLRPIGRLVVPLIHDALDSEGLSADTFGHLDADDVELAKTADRRVLGCMNDLANQCQWAIVEAGGIARLDVARLNHGLRRTILGPLGHTYPIDLAAAGAPPQADVEPSPPRLRLVQGGVQGRARRSLPR
jgi:hypothetical protein